MAEDNKVNHNVDPTTFAQPVPEKTELERLQERIANFKVQISPTVAQLAQVLMNQSLQNPTKPEDLDGYVQVRNELKLGLDEYQEQLANAQRRMTQLQQEHEIQKQTELARREEDLKAARDTERKRRKDYQHTARTLEAILRSHGVTVDLDGDGLIGLPKGQEPAILGEQDQATLKQLLDESKAAVGGTSRAFEKARALNPEPSPEVQEELPFDTQEEVAPPIASGTTTAEFEEEVREVESVYDNPAYDEPVTPDYGNKPVISDTNQPDIIEEELAKEEKRMDIIGQNGNTGEHYEEVEKPKVRMVEEDDIAEFETPPPAEETVEVTIPTESELKGMTKSKIRQEALGLGFEGVTTKDPKATMIENFVQATEKFISDLKDSGEFVSADEEESDDGETENDRDGGYFK